MNAVQCSYLVCYRCCCCCSLCSLPLFAIPLQFVFVLLSHPCFDSTLGWGSVSLVLVSVGVVVVDAVVLIVVLSVSHV